MDATTAQHLRTRLSAWETCRDEAQRLEGEIEGRIVALEGAVLRFDPTAPQQQRAGASTPAATAGRSSPLDATRLTQEAAALASLSDRLEAAVGNLVELQGRMRETCVVPVSPSADSVAAGGDTQALMAAVQAATRHTRRFEDIVADKRQAVVRLRADVQRAVGAGPRNEREALMSRVRTEVTAFESDPELRLLVQEQDSLRKSQALARQALEEGQRAHNRMQTQREMFDRIGSTALAIAEQAPVVRQVLGRIDSKRRREAVVLASVAGFLLFVTFLLW